MDASNKIEHPMLEAISKYLASKIPMYKEVDSKALVVDSLMSGGLFTKEDGVLGLSKIEEGLWEVLFFAAESKEARKSLIREAAKKLGKISIMFYRPKHEGREKTYSYKYWMRLA
jgi:hypothetical protein